MTSDYNDSSDNRRFAISAGATWSVQYGSAAAVQFAIDVCYSHVVTFFVAHVR